MVHEKDNKKYRNANKQATRHMMSLRDYYLVAIYIVKEITEMKKLQRGSKIFEEPPTPPPRNVYFLFLQCAMQKLS